jgi:SAM-dependent methyltransferase
MHSRRMAEAYDRIAPTFAATNAAMPASLVALGERFLALAGVNARVLDLGCGAGRDMTWLESRGARMIGADLSRGMLAETRARASGALVRMDMRQLGFGMARFDGVWCMAALLHLPKAEAPIAMREMKRALRPGGALLLALQAGDSEGWEPAPYGPVERFFARYARDEAERMIEQAGFAIQHTQINAASDRTWLQFLAAAPRKIDRRDAGSG